MLFFALFFTPLVLSASLSQLRACDRDHPSLSAVQRQLDHLARTCNGPACCDLSSHLSSFSSAISDLSTGASESSSAEADIARLFCACVEGKTESVTCAARQCSALVVDLISDISISSSSSSSDSDDDDDDGRVASPTIDETFPATIPGNEVETGVEIVPIFGTGNSADGYNFVSAHGIATGLRTRFRGDFRPGQFAGIPSGGQPNVVSESLPLSQFYSGFARNAAGVKLGGADKAVWSFDFAVNATASFTPLSDLRIFIVADLDPSPTATNFLAFNIYRGLNTGAMVNQGWIDNSHGDATSGNGDGDNTQYSLPPPVSEGFTVVQNSQNYDFFPGPDPNNPETANIPVFDRDAAGVYELRLVVQDLSGTPLVSNTVFVEIVPDPSVV